jgi:hypothetical protein
LEDETIRQEEDFDTRYEQFRSIRVLWININTRPDMQLDEEEVERLRMPQYADAREYLLVVGDKYHYFNLDSANVAYGT